MLASLINEVWTLCLSKQKVKDKVEMAARPENIDIKTRLVNEGIFPFTGPELARSHYMGKWGRWVDAGKMVLLCSF